MTFASTTLLIIFSGNTIPAATHELYTQLQTHLTDHAQKKEKAGDNNRSLLLHARHCFQGKQTAQGTYIQLATIPPIYTFNHTTQSPLQVR